MLYLLTILCEYKSIYYKSIYYKLRYTLLADIRINCFDGCGGGEWRGCGGQIKSYVSKPPWFYRRHVCSSIILSLVPWLYAFYLRNEFHSFSCPMTLCINLRNEFHSYSCPMALCAFLRNEDYKAHACSPLISLCGYLLNIIHAFAPVLLLHVFTYE